MKKAKQTLQKMKKSVTGAVALGVLMMYSSAIHAQAIGTAIDNASTQMTGIRSNVANLILALGGVIGLIGAIRVFIKWNNGDQDVQKSLIGWAGACIFLLLSGGLMTAFFG